VRRRYGGAKRRFLSDVSLEGDALAAPLLDHRPGFLGRGYVTGSTAMTFAPSSANRSTVARPLPIPSPGL
jgi:hypothetical protein